MKRSSSMLVVVALILLVGCGSDKTAETNPTDPETPVITETQETVVKIVPTGPAPTAPPAPPSAFDSDGDGFYTAEEFEQAVRARFPEYEWPADFAISADIIVQRAGATDTQIEAPGEYTVIGRYHACAWEITLLHAAHQNNQAEIDTALYQLREIGLKKNPLYRDEEGKAFMRDMYDKAELGETAPLQEWVKNNCQGMQQFFSATPVSLERWS